MVKTHPDRDTSKARNRRARGLVRPKTAKIHTRQVITHAGERRCNWFHVPTGRLVHPTSCHLRISPKGLASRARGQEEEDDFKGMAQSLIPDVGAMAYDEQRKCMYYPKELRNVGSV